MTNHTPVQNFLDIVSYSSPECIERVLENYREIESLALSGNSAVWDLYIDIKTFIDKSIDPTKAEIIHAIDTGDDKTIETVAILFTETIKEHQEI